MKIIIKSTIKMNKIFRSVSCFILLSIIINISENKLLAQTGEVLLAEKQWILPTYTVAEPERNPIFFRNETYQGASRHYYPLAMNDQYTNERVEKAWKALFLENEYIEVAITPEIGGKLYHATDKTNDYNFIYKNDVVKPLNIGMTGAWVSGGIEWCVLHHHRASTFLPLDYTTTENEDGSKTVWVGEYEPRHGMRWTIGVTVFPGKSYYKAEGRIFNASPFTHSFLYWANVATHTNENYQTIFPPSTQIVTQHSKREFSRWPISTERYARQDFTDGVDISWWKNVEQSASFFVHELKEDFMGGYDHGKNAGTVHIGDHNIIKGAKLWEWGSGPRGQATEAQLTENAGPYVELMVGAYNDNQPDYSWIRPYEVKRWEQFWYPVKGIEGFVNANLNGAVNLEERDDNSVFLGYYSTKKVNNAKVILRNGDDIIYERNIEISPDNPFTKTINIGGMFDFYDLHTELVDADSDELLVDYQPVELDPVEELPEPWRGYPDPEELETIEELYLTGKRVEQFYAARFDHMDWYREALRRDPFDARTNTAVGNNYLQNGDFTNAKKYLSRAIERLTMDYTRPITGEALYLQGLALKNLGFYEAAIDTLYRATWDYAYHSPAYFELAQISTMNGDFERALYQVNESIWTNARNNRAIALKASIQRRNGDFEEALATLQTIHKDDPLDFRLRNELYLIARESGNQSKADELLSLLNREMRDFHENYLELVVGYINDGLIAESEDMLNRFNGENPIFDYFHGYIQVRNGNKDQAIQHFQSAAAKPVDYIFPHRLKTVEVLKTALEHNPTDGKAYYYIGNILYDGQPAYSIENWEHAVKHNPDLAIAYRNLGWGYSRYYSDADKAISHYETALTYNSEDAIYYAELDALYEMINAPIETRLKLFTGNHGVVNNRDDAFIRQIDVLNLAGEHEKANRLLEEVHVAYREGDSGYRDVRIDAQLLLGKKYLDENDYENALKYFRLAQQVEETEAVSSRFGNRNIQVNYYVGLTHEALGNNKKAKEAYERATAVGTAGRTSTNIMAYYLGRSFEKLEKHDSAIEVFESMVADANNLLEASGAVDAGAFFGAREADNIRMSREYTLKGFGLKGLGRLNQAREDLKKAIELSNSNLWAITELYNI
jgi:tetratricopeptide (TPR) repeat protein